MPEWDLVQLGVEGLVFTVMASIPAGLLWIGVKKNKMRHKVAGAVLLGALLYYMPRMFPTLYSFILSYFSG